MRGSAPLNASAGRRLAAWIADFSLDRVSGAAVSATRTVLIDTLACALAGTRDATAQGSIAALEEVGGAPHARIIGTSRRTSVHQAAFANSVLIRTLDFNDFYGGARQGGHPSDTIGVALSVADWRGSSGRDFLEALLVGYELYCRLVDGSDAASPWDHVTASGLTAVAIAGRLMRLTEEQMTHALTMAAIHTATLAEIRQGHVSAAKSIASAVVAQTATFLTVLAAQGMTGPIHGLDGKRGLFNIAMPGVEIGELTKPAAENLAIQRVTLKAAPCFMMAQAAVAAGSRLHDTLRAGPSQIEKVTLWLADTPITRSQIANRAARSPDSRESADHSYHYLVAMALLDGEITLGQFDAGRWADPEVRELIGRIDLDVDAALVPIAAGTFPCRLRVTTRDGMVHSVDVACPPGHPTQPLSFSEVKRKFRRCAAGIIQPAAQAGVIDLVAQLETRASIRPLLSRLTAGEAVTTGGGSVV